MSYMFEVYYRPPVDAAREAALAERVSHLGGRLDFREDPAEGQPGGVCLTFEFKDIHRGAGGAAERSGPRASMSLSRPVDYGT